MARNRRDTAFGLFVLGYGSCLVVAAPARAQTPAWLRNQEPTATPAGDTSTGPDVVLAQITDPISYGSDGGVVAFMFGLFTCNLGDEPVQYFYESRSHPIMTNNLYRLHEGRFEQIGMAWVYHEFYATDGNKCGTCTDTDNSIPGTWLAVGCSTLNPPFILGTWRYLSPRSTVNAHTGYFPGPPPIEDFSDLSPIDRRMQVHGADLDPVLYPGALYFAEGQVIAPDDAAAGNQNNNVSYGPVEFLPVGTDGNDAGTLIDLTRAEQAAIRAWHEHDPSVVETDIQIREEGLLILAVKVTDVGDGWWRYEYALQNINSDRSVRAFAIPLRDNAWFGNLGFHDVDYHSGDPFDGTDWSALVSDGSISWSTSRYEADANANALRWGTLYNFRFDARACPGETTVSLELFKPGVPSTITAPTIGPRMRNLGDFTGDCVVDLADVDAFVTCLGGPAAAPAHAICTEGDLNGDAHIDLVDVAAFQSSFARP